MTGRDDRPTPHLVVDADVLDANVAAMAAFARDHGLVLRPHAKTHKSPDVARLQLDAGAVGLTVATVSEAEVFADAGCTDLFLAYPLWVDAARGARVRALTERVRLTVGVDPPLTTRGSIPCRVRDSAASRSAADSSAATAAAAPGA